MNTCVAVVGPPCSGRTSVATRLALQLGVPLLSALKIAQNATGSTLLAERIAEATESVRDGKRLSEPLAKGGFFPDRGRTV